MDPGKGKTVQPVRSPKNWSPTVRSLRTYGPIFLCLALLSGCASNEDWVRFRPDATSPFSGVEQPHPKPYTGQVSFLRGMYDPNAGSAFAGTLDLNDIDGYGLWISARPSEWYIAPEIGYIGSAEDNGANGKIRNYDFFAGARVVAELPFTPLSIIGGLGINSLQADIDSIDNGGFHYIPSYEFDETVYAPYFHIGVLLHMGDHAHLGLDYRSVDYGDDLNPIHTPRRLTTDSIETLNIMAGVNW